MARRQLAPTESATSSTASKFAAGQSGAHAGSAEGGIIGIHDGTVVGWAWNPEQPYETVDVEFYIEDIRVASGAADKFDIELAKAQRGNGMHRFEIRLDRLPAKSPPFVIRALVAGTRVELLPSISIATLDEAERLLSGHDYVGEVSGVANGAVCGWVLNRRNPHDAPLLTLRDGDTDVVTHAPSERITRVLDSGVTVTAFRFELSLPQNVLDGKLHALTVLVGGPEGRALGTPVLFGASDVTSIARALLTVSERLDLLERRLESYKPAWDVAQLERRVASKVVEPVDMLLNVHRDSVEREMAVVQRQITEIIRHIPEIDLDFLAPSVSVPAIEDVAVPSPAAFDPIDRNKPLVAFELSTRPLLVQPRGDVRWISADGEASLAVYGAGSVELDGPLGDSADVVIKGSGASDTAELVALIVGYNGRPMSGRFDVFDNGQWAFTGSAIEGGGGIAPARPTLTFDYLSGTHSTGRLRIHDLSFFAPGRGPSRTGEQAPNAAILNLGREASSAGWHPVEAGRWGGICWMGEMSDVSVNLHPSGTYRIDIPEIRPLVAELIPKMQIFLDGEPFALEISPMAKDSSAYMVQGRCVIRSGSQEMHTLRISFPGEDVKSPMELGLNPDLRPLSIAVRCIMLSAEA
ncbi:MAG TPA: hypothetical protein VGK90_11765 [Rhizomicrobium sp.]